MIEKIYRIVKGEKHVAKRLMSIGSTTVMVFGLAITVGQAFAQEKAAAPAAPQAKPTIAKICTNCHQAEPGNLRGNFDGVAYQSDSIQIKIDDATEILKFDPKTLCKVKNVQPDPNNPSEPLRAIKKGKEVRVEYTEKDGKKFATLVFEKVAIKVRTRDVHEYCRCGEARSTGPGERQVPAH